MTKEIIMTPYEMDLKEAYRIPDRAPKVGDVVKIKSIDWYNKWKSTAGTISAFVWGMEKYCGKCFRVERIYPAGAMNIEGNSAFWRTYMFEEVYPKESIPLYKPTPYAVHPLLATSFIINPTPEKKEPNLKLINNNKPIKLKKV